MFPPQDDGVSYGVDEAGNEGCFVVPTPGELNQRSVVSDPPNTVQEMRFSVERGFQTEPFSLELLSDTESAQARYTTDGTTPTKNHGVEYVAPFSIASTTNVRAGAYRPDVGTARVTTASYNPPRCPTFPLENGHYRAAGVTMVRAQEDELQSSHRASVYSHVTIRSFPVEPNRGIVLTILTDLMDKWVF